MTRHVTVAPKELAMPTLQFNDDDLNSRTEEHHFEVTRERAASEATNAAAL
jgi:hypothetical protein